MSMWTAIVVIVAICAFASVMRARALAGHDDFGGASGMGDGMGDGTHSMAPRQPDPELLREIEALRKRLEVLERIATDDRQTRSIAAEIESLRDK